MKSKIFLTLALFVFTIQFSQSQDPEKSKMEFRTIKQNVFTAGEKLTFEINYLFVTAGYAVMEISPHYQIVNGRNCYDISVNVKSTSSFDKIYKVRDNYKCILDKDGLFPWRFEQHIKEGNYERDFEALFDQENHKVKTYVGNTDPKEFKGEYIIPEYVQDIVSVFYYFRTFDFSNMKEGDKVKLENFYKDKTYPVDVTYHGKETIDVSAGEFRCLKIEPLVVAGGLFKSEGEIIVWLTDDDRRMPVQVKTKVLIGSINIELSKYVGLAGPLNSKID